MMNPNDNMAALREQVARLEHEMDAALEALATIRHLDFVIPLEALEEQLVPTVAAVLPTYAVRA